MPLQLSQFCNVLPSFVFKPLTLNNHPKKQWDILSEIPNLQNVGSLWKSWLLIRILDNPWGKEKSTMMLFLKSQHWDLQVWETKVLIKIELAPFHFWLLFTVLIWSNLEKYKEESVEKSTIFLSTVSFTASFTHHLSLQHLPLSVDNLG